MAQLLIVNGDDFGQTTGINRGIARAHEQGILTSASLMVCGPAASEASAYAASHPALSVGLHFDAGEWSAGADGWVPLYQRVSLAESAAVQREVDRQFELFRQLLGRDPTHVDSHQHVHRHEPLLSILRGRACQLGVPLRGSTPAIHHCGAFYGQTGSGQPWPGSITTDGFISLLSTLPEGITEIGCHPADSLDTGGMYRGERMQELETLCDPRLRSVLSERAIILTSFAGVQPQFVKELQP